MQLSCHLSRNTVFELSNHFQPANHLVATWTNYCTSAYYLPKCEQSSTNSSVGLLLVPFAGTIQQSLHSWPSAMLHYWRQTAAWPLLLFNWTFVYLLTNKHCSSRSQPVFAMFTQHGGVDEWELAAFKCQQDTSVVTWFATQHWHAHHPWCASTDTYC